MVRTARLVVGLLLLTCYALAAAGEDTEESYYDILGVAKDADKKQIKRAYRKQALKWHPDKNKGNKEEAEKRFVKVAEAYEVLSDPDSRAKYDRYGKGGFKAGAGAGGGGFNFRHASDVFKDVFGDVDPFDFDSDFFDEVEEEDFQSPSELASAKLSDFYKKIGKLKKNATRILEKFKGREQKLFRLLNKRYRKKYRQAVVILKQEWQEAGVLEQKVERVFANPESARLEAMYRRMGMGGSMGGRMGGRMGGGMGGMGGSMGSTSFSFSSTTMGPDGQRKTVRSQSHMQGGRRVTRTVESDGETTTATEEEHDGTGRVKRKRGRKSHRATENADTPHVGL